MIKTAPATPTDGNACRTPDVSLRVLMCLHPSAEVGGLETSFGRIVHSLRAAGIAAEALVAGAGAANSATAFYLRSVMPVHVGGGLRSLITLIKGYDVVHVHSSSGTTDWPAAAVIAARVAGVPIVVSLHLPGVPPPRPRLRGRIKARILAAPRQVLLAVAADVVACPSVAAASIARRRLVPLPVRVRPLWNGVPDSGRVAVPEDGPLRLVFVGRLSEHKRPFEFLDAVELALQRGADVVGHMVGDGPLRDGIERRVASSAHSERFIVHGSLPDPWRILQHGHALVLMSRHEGGGPLVMMEAGATGRGTVARQGVEGVADDWPDAVVLVPRDGGATAFANAFCELAADLPRVAQLGAAARARYEEFFTADHSSRRLLAAYDDAIRRRQGRRR